MAQTQTPTMTPPPDPTDANLKSTVGDKIGGFLGAISNPGSALGTISAAFDRAHDKRLAKAKMYHDVMVEKMGHPAYADQNDPDHQRTVDAYNAAEAEYLKLAPDPETKKQMQMRANVAKHHVASQSGMTPPPSPSTTRAQTAPAASGGAGATQSPTNAALPPPPAAPDMTKVMAGIPGEMQAEADKRALKQEQEKSDIEQARQIAVEKAKPVTAATKPQKLVSNVSGADLAKEGVTLADGTPVDPNGKYERFRNVDGTQFAVPSGTKQFIGEGKLEMVGGIPTGRVMHNGKFVAPGDPAYTAEDKAAIQKGMDAANLSQKEKEQLMRIRGDEYARARAQFTFKNVIDKETGEAADVSALDMARPENRGRYSEPSEQEKISARDSVHESLNNRFDALSKSLEALPEGLDTDAQAVIRLSIRNEEPGMIDQLITNKIKEHASEQTLQYLTDIKALQEDVMSLRSVAGITGSSDSLRNAMVALVPGVSTSSVMEARMQLKAAHAISDALFKGRPQSTLGPGNTTIPRPPTPKQDTKPKNDPLEIR